MIDDSIRSQLQELYTSLYVSRDLDPDDSSDDTIQTFHGEICARKEKYNQSRTLCKFHHSRQDMSRSILFHSESKNEAPIISSPKHMISINMH